MSRDDSPYSRFRNRLEEAYSGLDDLDWISANQFPLNELKSAPAIALAGSIASSLCKGFQDTRPGDIDIVARDLDSARKLLHVLEDRLLDMQYTHWKVLFNHRTKFVPKNCTAHYRFHSSVWLPICIFVLKEGKFRNWFTPEGYSIQYYEHIKAAKKDIEEMREEMREGMQGETSQEPEPYRVHHR